MKTFGKPKEPDKFQLCLLGLKWVDLTLEAWIEFDVSVELEVSKYLDYNLYEYVFAYNKRGFKKKIRVNPEWLKYKGL